MSSRGNATSQIRNKVKRGQVYAKLKAAKKKEKKEQKAKRKREVEELGADAPPKQIPRTLDNTREADDTVVEPEDEEVQADVEGDEFAPYFDEGKVPKIMVTTRPRPSSKLFSFIQELMTLFPRCYYYPRKTFNIKEICEYASNKNFTHLIVLSEKSKVCNGAIVSHLPGTAKATKIGNENASAMLLYTLPCHVPSL